MIIVVIYFNVYRWTNVTSEILLQKNLNSGAGGERQKWKLMKQDMILVDYFWSWWWVPNDFDYSLDFGVWVVFSQRKLKQF